MSTILPFLLNRSYLDPFSLRNDSETLLSNILPLMSGDSINYIPGQRGSTSIKSGGSKFQVNLDVHHFAPDEIDVKVIDGHVVIVGTHDEKRDMHGWVSRKFTRRILLPEGCDPQTIISRLSSDGVLSVIGLNQQAVAGERVVPITQTGPIRTQPSQDTVVEPRSD